MTGDVTRPHIRDFDLGFALANAGRFDLHTGHLLTPMEFKRHLVRHRRKQRMSDKHSIPQGDNHEEADA